MAESNIVVANLASGNAATPPPLTEETKVEESPFYEPIVDVVMPSLYGDKKKADEPEPKVEPEAKAEPEPKVEAPKHSAESISEAAKWGIPADDVADMSPKELGRTIKHMASIAQAAFDAGKGQVAPKAEEKPAAKVEDDGAFLPADYEAELDPKFVKPLKDKFAQAKKDLDQRDQRIAALEQEVIESRRERIHARLDGLVQQAGPEAVKVLDRSTAQGQQKFQELLVRMKFVQDESRALGKDLSEKEILKEAVGRMGITASGAADKGKAQDDAVEQKLKEKQEAFDAGALAKPESRKKKPGVHEVVRDKLKKIGLPVAEKTEDEIEVDWR